MAEQSRKKAGKAKKIILTLAVLAIVAVLFIAVAGPGIASALAPGIISSAAGQQILGDVTVDKVALRWTGSQRIEGLRLADPDGGADVITLSGTLDRGLIALATNPADLGTLRVDALSINVRDTASGATNIQRAIEPTPSARAASRPSAPGAPSAPAEPLRLPKGFAVQIEGQGLTASYATTGADGQPVVIVLSNIAIDGSVSGADARLTITGDAADGTRALDIAAEALALIAPDGTVDPSKAQITVNAFADAPPGSPIDASLRLHVEGRDGRARLASSTPGLISALIPASMLSPAPSADSPISFVADGPLSTSIEIRQLDVPLPTASGFADIDWRNAVFEAVIATGAVSGRLTDASGTRVVGLEPATITAYTASELFDLGVLGKLAMVVDGVSTGSVTIDAKAIGILDADGKLRKSDMDFLRAQVIAEAIPTALIQPFAQDANIDLREAFGETIRLDLRAGQLGAQAASHAADLDKMLGQEGASKELAGRPYLAATLDSEKTTAYLDFILDQTVLQTRNNGVRIHTDAAGALARRFLPTDAGIALEGDGSAIIELKNLRLPIADGIDLRGATYAFRGVIGTMTALIGEQQTPIAIDSVDLVLAAAPGEDPSWKLDARGTHEGKQFAALGAGSVPGLMAPASDKTAPLGLSVATARPQGELTLIDVPTGLAKLASADAANLADAVFGPTIRGQLTSTPSGADTIDVGIRLEGASAAIDGSARVSKTAVEIGQEGITAAITRTGAVLNALSGPEGAERLRFSDGGRTTATIRNITAPLGGAIDPRALSAGLDVTLAEITATARKADGTSVPISIIDGALKATLATGGAFDATINASGTASGQQTTITGAAKGILPDGSDPMAAVRALESASLDARNIPTALLGIFDDNLATIAMEAAGETANLALTPGTDKSWDLRLTGRDLAVTSAVRLDRDAWAVGPTAGSMVLTPALLDAAAGDALASMTPRPRLDRAVALEMNAERFRVAPTDGTWGLATGETLAARLRATGDLIVRDVAQLGEGAAASAGIRGLEANVSMDAAGAGGASVRGLVFEPDANTNVASVTGNVRLPATPLIGEVHITDGDVAALDRMLGTDGLLVEALGNQIALDAQMQGAGGAVTADVKAPRLTATASLTRTPDGAMRLTQPAKATWNASPAAVDRLVLGVKPGVDPGVRATSDLTVDLTIDRMALGPAATPLKPGAFDLAGTIRTTRLALKKTAGESVDLPALTGAIRSEASTTGVSFDLASAQGEASTVKVVGRVDNLADAAGALTTDAASVTADIDGRLPSALIDALASTDGLLGALAGPTLTIDANAQNFGRQTVGGIVDAKASSDNATATIGGRITAPGVLLLRDASEIRVTRITPEGSQRIFAVLVPFLTSFEKSDQDTPATVVVNRFEAPIDGDLTNLNGELILSLGTMSFETKTFLSKLLKILNQRDAGSVGRRIEPVTFQINSGIATYEKMTIPTGEFTMESYGSLNLVDQTMDIFVLVPVYALAEEVAGVVSQVPGLDRLTSVPISIKGPFDNPNTKLDLEEMIKKAPQNIGSGLEGLIGGVLGGLTGDKASDDDKDAEPKKELTPEEKAAKQEAEAAKKQRKKEKEEEEKRKKQEKKDQKKSGGGGGG